MASPVAFWFDFASTYSYLAAEQIESRAAGRGLTVHWRPFPVGFIFQKQGWNDSPFNIYPAKGRYMWRDMERLTAAAGLPFRKPSEFPRKSVLAARVACLGEQESWLPEFCRRTLRANFVLDRDIGAPEVLTAILDELGLPGARLCAETQQDPVKERLRARTAEAERAGIFGAPSFVVDGELFWGQDRLDAALDWAAGQRPPGLPPAR